jgi:hypothetical protein
MSGSMRPMAAGAIFSRAGPYLWRCANRLLLPVWKDRGTGHRCRQRWAQRKPIRDPGASLDSAQMLCVPAAFYTLVQS